MKKILTVSLVAMMAVSAAHADLASTAYVDTQASAAQTAAEATAAADATAKASAAQAAAEAKVTALTEGAVATNTANIATNAENIAKNAQAITDGDDAVKATIGTVEAGKTVVQMIADAKTAATYDDTEVRGLISDNANAIDAIETSAYATSGITSGLVGKISTNESAITTLNAGAETAGSVDNKIAAATANMATDTELSDGLATKQGTLIATATIGIADNGAISVNNASIGETQLSEDVNAALALADTSFQMSAVKAAAEGGDGQYALTMTVGADNSITYQWNKISYGD